MSIIHKQQRLSSINNNNRRRNFNSLLNKYRLWLIILLFIIIVVILFIIFYFIFIASSHKSLDDLFTMECIRAHDNYRKKHGISTMNADQKLIKLAAKRADKLIELDKLIHLPQSDQSKYYGENLYMIFGDYSNCETVTKSWYDEFIDYKYNFNQPDYHPETGHATQVIWKFSINLGCAQRSFQHYGRPKQYTVCMYNPAGNILGQFKQNIFPPK